jgi:hypothetical protein
MTYTRETLEDAVAGALVYQMDGSISFAVEAVMDAILPLLGDDDAEFHVGRNHPDTSRQMSDKVKAGSLLEDVLNAFIGAALTHQAGATDDDIEVLLRRSHQSVSGARNTLVKKGYLISTGRTRPNRYGNAATIWEWTRKERA